MGIKQEQLIVDHNENLFWNEPIKTVNGQQYGGNHYKDKAIQPWDYVIANKLGYLEGSIIKYISRYKDKNGVEDLLKARHFLDKLIETESNK